jgi:hypothetical protein
MNIAARLCVTGAMTNAICWPARAIAGLVVVAFVVGCVGSCSDHRPTDDNLCRKMSGMCRDEYAVTCFGEAEWAGLTRELGTAVVTRFRGCVATADSCEDMRVCWELLSLAELRDPSDDQRRPR